MASSHSERKCFMEDWMGHTAASPSGQTVLELGPAAPDRARVAALPSKSEAGCGERDIALACFERGCLLDCDPKTQAEAAELYVGTGAA